VQTATFGWILPMLHDPDGHEIRFSTISSHTQVGDTTVIAVDPRQTAQRRGDEDNSATAS
jgi:hypothetical protein